MASIKPRPQPLNYAISGVLENKTISYRNIGSLKTTVKGEGIKTSQFILKAFESYRKRCWYNVWKEKKIARHIE